MKSFIGVVFFHFVLIWYVQAQSQYRFPDELLFGVATAAYQVEGAWDQDGKGPSIWDTFTQQDPSPILNGDNGNVACDSYNKYEEDVALAARLGVQFYRFSISWPRILPDGNAININPFGITYYQNLISEILSYNMTPMATLYHWDLPQTIQDEIGGFNSTLLVDLFVDYARVCFKNFPEVEYWLTFNEPRSICHFGYGVGWMAPGIQSDGIGDYQCAYVLLKAHAETYHMYKKEFANYTAKISLALDGQWSEPLTNSAADIKAAERKLNFELGLYAHPLFVGDWPPVVIERVAKRSSLENRIDSRLPTFTEEEIERIVNTTDFLGFNSYFTYYVADASESPENETSFDNDIRASTSTHPDWPTGSNGSPVVPWGMRKILKWIKDNYKSPEIFITENGVSENGSTLEDDSRISYYTEYLSAVLESIHEDQVNIIGYTAWSLLDNFEWIVGYSQRFGLHYVDFTVNNRTRTPKKSASFYADLIANRSLPQFDEADNTTDSSDPNTTNPNPTDSDSTDPNPTDPDPTYPNPTDPNPTDPDSTDPNPTDPDPTDPNPTDPNPTDPDPTDPNPTDPDPTEPNPTDPDPTEPDDSEPDYAEKSSFVYIPLLILTVVLLLSK